MAREKAGALGVFLVLGMVAMIGLGLGLYFQLTQQTALGESEALTQQTATVAAELKAGDAATQKFLARDKESDNSAQVATSLYVEEWSDGGVGKGAMVLISDATALSATATTSVGTEVGKWLKACAFNKSTYYSGDCQEFEVVGEGSTTSLDVYAINTMVKVEVYDDGSKLTGGFDTVSQIGNLSLAANQKDSLDYLKITQNNSNGAFNFKGVVVNVTDASNIKDVSLTGSVAWDNINSAKYSHDAPGSLVKGAVPERLAQPADYAFYLEEAVLLHEFDGIRTPSIQLEARATDPSAEFVHFLLVDEGMYRSSQSVPFGLLKSGVEDDQDTEADVGGSDRSIYVHIE